MTEESDVHSHIATDDISSKSNRNIASLLQVYTFFSLMFQTLFKLSDRAVTVLFFCHVSTTISCVLLLSIPASFLSKLPKSICAARILAEGHPYRNFLCNMYVVLHAIHCT